MAEAKSKKTTKRIWSHEIVNSRNLPARLNELSAAGSTIFSANPSLGMGGSYEVVYYIDKTEETPSGD